MNMPNGFLSELFQCSPYLNRHRCLSWAVIVLWSFLLPGIAIGDNQTVQISNGNDDVEERATDGNMNFNSTDIELGNETPTGSEQTEGLRFNGLLIPPGATITQAYLTFTVDETDTVETIIDIHAEDTDNATPFSSTAYDLTGRSRTTAKTTWNIPSWTVVGEEKTSPDVSAVVQEVIDRPGWGVGNSMVFVIFGTGSRTSESYNGSVSGAAKLYVAFTPATPTGNPPVSSFNSSCLEVDCSFTDTSTDSDGSVVSWAWNFGDGSVSTGQNPSHTYATDGTYQVYLTVTDNNGNSDFSTQQVEACNSAVSRGPYLQTMTEDSVIIRWRTGCPTDTYVRWGSSTSDYGTTTSVSGNRTEHTLTLAGLSPSTTYYYSIGNSSGALAGQGDASFRFTTSPTPGDSVATRFWVIGDSGTANANARAVRDRYKEYALANGDADFILMLGDNAYNSGTDSEYQAAVFNTYPELLRNLPVWPTLGNHDGYTADSATQSGPYYDIFNLPTAGEAGGLASGTEAYYSFDYGDIHFVVLDSYETSRAAGGAMMTWLEADLVANDKPWVIAFWHHPPYTKGSHDSDTEGQLIDMREIALPILEAAGVDLVLGGHSHSYERSVLLDGHYDVSSTLNTSTMVLDGGDGSEAGDGAYRKPGGLTMNEGAVYAVAGSSGKLSSVKTDWPHPVMISYLEELGSMVIDIEGDRLDAIFINSSGVINDNFTILKTDCTASQSMASRKWLLFSLPCMPDDARASRIFAEGPAETDYGTRWNLWSYNPVSQRYEHLDADTAMVAGKGYWYYSIDAHDSVRVSGSINAGTAVSLVTNTDPSIGTWNLVGNPHNTTINWKDVTIYDGATPYSWSEMDPETGGYDCEQEPTVGPECFMWHVMNKWENGSAYAAYDGQVGVGGTLGPFEAMWVRTHRGDSIEMNVPAAAPAPAKADVAQRPGKRPWDVNLIAESRDFRDSANWLGQAANASNGLDSRDLEEWAPFSANDYLTILFTNKKFGATDWGYTRDFRSLTGTPKGKWDFVVRASANISMVTLSWQGDIGLFDKARLVNRANGEAVAVEPGGSYTFVMEGREHPFSIEFK